MRQMLRFWSNFLCQNFNNNMYRQFKKIAWEDYECESRVALDLLFNFYLNGLKNHLRHDVYNDFQNDAIAVISFVNIYYNV